MELLHLPILIAISAQSAYIPKREAKGEKGVAIYFVPFRHVDTLHLSTIRS